MSKKTTDSKGKTTTATVWEFAETGEVRTGDATAMIAAGSSLYAGGTGWIRSFRLPLNVEEDATATWEIAVEGTVVRLLAASGKLFAVTREGRLLCFGQEAGPVRVHRRSRLPRRRPTARRESARPSSTPQESVTVIASSGCWAARWGLVRQSRLHVVVVDPSAMR